ncbi:putative fumarylacetoacetate hydrolase protein [Botryosphaeria dothidea]|uniref:Fumarylacetoacetase n=1 Tax=Botryosphaeria dothidea TaxID=55169 RepID=A0A8H4J679_9PEZI|nr:putative fumarylacetoacetate hydrolase protein [Botryosphaeria dothidea]
MSGDQFPVENIPFGIISTPNEPTVLRPATRIHDTAIDLAAFSALGAFSAIRGYVSSAFESAQSLNVFAALAPGVRRAVRSRIQESWKDEGLRREFEGSFLPAASVTNHLPMETVNYADYVSSRGHAENMADVLNHPTPFRAPFYHSPLGYYGNSRNIVVSDSPVYRFAGVTARQFQTDGPAESGASKKFDFELELGVYLARPSKIGQRIKLEEVDDYVFGFVLLNDWSARDIQSSESAGPTGPFLGKSGCVTVSPWIVTLDALAPARAPRQMASRLPFVDYLSEDAAPADDLPCIDLRCSVDLRPGGSDRAFEVCKTEYRQTYWTHRQLVAHQTRNGSAVGTGDLIGTGTMSMFESDDFGRCCLAERSYNGTKPFDVGNSHTRTWLEDGDEVNIQGWVHDAKTGKKLFGFGNCRGVVVPLPE